MEIDYKKIYAVKALPYFWNQKAKELKRASDMLLTTVEDDMKKISIQAKGKIEDLKIEPWIGDIQMFLAAASLENLFKGLILTIYPEYIIDGKFQNKIMGSHKLVHLADKAKIRLTIAEKEYCIKGTDYIEIWGKYTIPKDHIKMEDEHKKLPFNPINLYNSLFKKLQDELEKRASMKSSIKVKPKNE